MGNALSPTGNILATAAMAKHLSISKDQVLLIRNTLMPVANLSSRLAIRRQFFQLALKNAKIRNNPDKEVLELLFIMMDTNGSGRVPVDELCTAVAILACPGEKFDEILSFVLKVNDVKGSGNISSRDALHLLQTMNTTASYFGDVLFDRVQIFKLVDNVYDIISLISFESEDYTHEELLKRLCNEQIVRNVLYPRQIPLVRGMPQSFPVGILSSKKQPLADHLSDESEEITCSSYSLDPSSHMSMTMTPLAKINVLQSRTE